MAKVFTLNSRFSRAMLFSAAWLIFWYVSVATYMTWTKHWTWLGTAHHDTEGSGYWALGLWAYPMTLMLYCLGDLVAAKKGINTWIFFVVGTALGIILYPIELYITLWIFKILNASNVLFSLFDVIHF